MLGNFKGRVKSVVYIQYEVKQIGNYAPITTISLRTPPRQEKFDEEGRVMESLSFDKDLHIIRRTQFVYNAMGLKTKQKHYDEVGKLETRFVTVYNEVGDHVANETYDGNGKLLRRQPFVKVDKDDFEEMFDLENSSGSWEVRGEGWNEVLNDEHVVIERYKDKDKITWFGASKETYKYDSHGNITGRYTYRSKKYELSQFEEWHYQYYDDVDVVEESENEIDNDDLAF